MEKTTISKNQLANVGKYSYKYVDIAQIHEYLEGINARYIQQVKRIENDDYIMTKRCFNDKWEEEWLQGCKVVDATLIGVKNPAQEQGSALTYARRYSLLMAFGLATDDDNAQSLSRKKEVEMTEEEAKNYVLSFGKNKGKKIDELEQSYIDWLLDNSNDEELLMAIKLVTGQVPMSEEESNERIKLLSEFNKLIIQTDTNPDDIYEHYKVESNSKMTNEQLKEANAIMEKKVK